MILNLHISLPDARTAEAREGAPPGLFRLDERPPGEWRRWGQALLLAALVHVGGVGAWLVSPPAPRPPVPPEPELVFFSFPPPPAAASSAPVMKSVSHPARVRIPSPQRPHLPALVKPVEPAPEAPAEVEPESVPEPTAEAPAVEAAPIEGVSGVIGGLVGGALGGREGGLVGATGGAALDLKQVSRAPRVLEQTPPLYPRRARADGIGGLVLVRVIIGVDGQVEPGSPQVLRSVPALDEAALAAVRQWRFTPALGREGRPVRVLVDIPFEFSLK